MQREAFDAAYFKRFYEKSSTRVHGKKEIARLARGITGLIAWLGGDLRSVLDVGAGVGLWRDWFARHRPDVRYRSTDVSEYACKKYGHEQADISTWVVRDKFDLIVCQGVLPYLDDAACARAIDNLGAMSRGFLYLEAITKRDLGEVCDLEATDVAVFARTGQWYREHLQRHFVNVGCGLYYTRKGGIRFYELEVAGP
jgi:hypothetical protein